MDIRDFFEFEDAVNEFFYFLFLEEKKENTLNELLNLFSILSQIEPKYENTYKFLSANILNLKKQTLKDENLSKAFLKLSNLAKRYFKKENSKDLLLKLKNEKKKLKNILETKYKKDNLFISKLLELAYIYLQDNLNVIGKLLKFKFLRN